MLHYICNFSLGEKMPFFMPITMGAKDFSSAVSGFCHSLVVDGHRVEVNPNSRVRRSVVSEEAHAPRSSV